MLPRTSTLVFFGAMLGGSLAARAGDPTPAPGPADPPIPIFLNAPADLDAFWKRLASPDFVLVDGELFRKLREAGEGALPARAASGAVVESIAIGGEVAGDWARLVVEFHIAMSVDGPSWVPIQLDGLTISDARDGSGELATRVAEGKAWQVELKGRGEHAVRVELLAPVRSTVEGKRLDLPIPPASSTRLELVVPQTVVDARTGPNEPVGIGSIREGAGVRLSTRLSPRSRIELAWRERADPAIKLPTLLSAQGEISLEIERGSIRSRSSWVLGSIRGTASWLTLRLDSAEELLDIEVDGKPVQVDTRREGPRSVVSIPLGEPLRPGSNRTLLLNTRRPISSSGAARVALQGYSFDQAKVQTGLIAIARAGPLFLNPSPGRGLRRIDPRTELPESLRGRQDTTLAFEFNDQPFELGLAVEPAPPRLRVESRTTVAIDPRSAKVQSRLDCRTSQGRVFEVRVLVPAGLEFEGAEPAEVVESTRVVPVDTGPSPSPGVEAPRMLTIALTPKARESEAFTVVLRGSSPVDPSLPVALPIFRPLADSSSGSRFAVVSDRNVTVEPSPPVPDGPQPFRVDWGLPPSDWDWPGRRPGPEMGVLWLRAEASPETMPLKVTVRPRAIRHESTLSASVDRRGVDVVEEISVEVSFGVINRLDLAFPADFPSRWEVEGVDLAAREPLGQDAGGVRRYRLRFAKDNADAFRLRVRYRLPFAEPLEPDSTANVRLELVRVLEGTSTGRKVVVSSEPGFELKAEAKGWTSSSVPDESWLADSTSPTRVALASTEERPGPVNISVKAGPRSPLPSVVVSRLWVRTSQKLENDLITSARMWVESRDGSMTVGLPTGSRWVRARVGGTDLGSGNVEALGADVYRVRLPGPTGGGPVLVTIEFEVPAAATSGGLPTLRILGDGVVLQTTWEVNLLVSRAGIGTPSGWSDENEWFWAGPLWKRRPRRSPIEVFHWLTGGNPRLKLDAPIEPVELAGQQSYLFSRVGPPSTLRFPVLSRLAILLVCSGPVLVFGLMVLARRPPRRLIAGSLLVAAFAAGSWMEPDVFWLVAQSSALGVGLWVSALAMNWTIDRTGHPRPSGEAPLIVTPPPAASSMVRPPPSASDDSTAIRARPATPSAVSTADHFFLIRPPSRHPEELPPASPEYP